MRLLIRLCTLLLFAAPVSAADKVVDLAPDNQFAGRISLGAATGGPVLRDVVAPDIAALVFTSDGDGEPVHGWFTRTYKASLKTNGMLAKKPEVARYELTAEIGEMAITPTPTGSVHKSQVTFRLRDIAADKIVWEQVQTTDRAIDRGIRFGKIGGAIGAAAGGAITGQNSAVTAAQISASQGRIRPFDIRIDVYEGIMKGFQDMAERTVAALAILPNPIPALAPAVEAVPPAPMIVPAPALLPLVPGPPPA